MQHESNIDWQHCSLVEINPRVLSGAPVLINSRMPVDTIVDNFEYGVTVEEIAEQFELPRTSVQAILTYAKDHRLALLFDKNVPVGARRFLMNHVVSTIIEMGWPPQIENGELLKAAETWGFEALVTCDQNIQYQQNLSGRKLALVVLGSNIWPIVRQHAVSIAAAVDGAMPGSYAFLEMQPTDRAVKEKL